MRGRGIALCVVLGALSLVACDPMAYRAAAFAPKPGVATDSARQSAALSAIVRVVERRGLAAGTGTWGDSSRCFYRRSLTLCGRQKSGQIQLSFLEGIGAIRLSPFATSLRRELVDTLRTEFGLTVARECKTSPVLFGLFTRGDCDMFFDHSEDMFMTHPS